MAGSTSYVFHFTRICPPRHATLTACFGTSSANTALLPWTLAGERLLP